MPIPFEFTIDLNTPVPPAVLAPAILSLRNNYFIQNGANWEGKPTFTRAEVGQFINDIYQIFVLDPVYANLIPVDVGVIIFFTETLVKGNDASGNPITYHGIADTGATASCIFRQGIYTANIAHEVLHTLGLPHSWATAAPNPVGFKEKTTTNFMDYLPTDIDERRKSLWKWQWDTIPNDPGIQVE